MTAWSEQIRPPESTVKANRVPGHFRASFRKPSSLPSHPLPTQFYQMDLGASQMSRAWSQDAADCELADSMQPSLLTADTASYQSTTSDESSLETSHTGNTANHPVGV